MRAIAILTLCLPLMATANAQEGCAGSGALQRYEDVRDNHVPAVDELGDAEIELAKTAYGAVQSGVIKETVRRTGGHKFGVNMLMPILGNVGNISDTMSSDPQVQFDGALGILNNTALKLVQPLRIDDLARDILRGLQGESPASPGVSQDRLNRMQLKKTMEGRGCPDEQDGLPAYQADEYSYYIPDSIRLTDACKGVSYHSLFNQLGEFDANENEAGVVFNSSIICDSPIAREVVDLGGFDYTARASILATAYGSEDLAIAEMNGIRRQYESYDGGQPGIFSSEAIGIYEGVDGGIGNGTARRKSWYRDRNVVVNVNVSISSHYNDTPNPPAPSHGAEESIARQAFGLIHEGNL